MNGIILVDKEKDFTSFDVAAIMRKLCGTKKVGHTGTLDPMATGVLPVLIGSCTKIQPYLKSGDKRYTATFRLGISTDTQDMTGTIISEKKVTAAEKDVRAVIGSFVGEITQIPPMYSAVKVKGVKLYTLARQGIEIPREGRRVNIYSIDYIGSPGGNAYTIDVLCSSGTYIRSLVSDIGEKLLCGAVLTSLCRTMSHGFPISACRKLSEIRSISGKGGLGEILITPEEIFSEYPAVSVTKPQAVRFKNGGGLSFDRIDIKIPAGYYKVYHEGTLLGLGRADDTKKELKVTFHID